VLTSPSTTIECVECGGTAHLMSYLPEDEPLVDGYPITYRCADCMERFDFVWEDDD